MYAFGNQVELRGQFREVGIALGVDAAVGAQQRVRRELVEDEHHHGRLVGRRRRRPPSPPAGTATAASAAASTAPCTHAEKCKQSRVRSEPGGAASPPRATSNTSTQVAPRRGAPPPGPSPSSARPGRLRRWKLQPTASIRPFTATASRASRPAPPAAEFARHLGGHHPGRAPHPPEPRPAAIVAAHAGPGRPRQPGGLAAEQARGAGRCRCRGRPCARPELPQPAPHDPAAGAPPSACRRSGRPS